MWGVCPSTLVAFPAANRKLSSQLTAVGIPASYPLPRAPLQPYTEPADKALSRDWSRDEEESPDFWQDLIDKQVLRTLIGRYICTCATPWCMTLCDTGL